MTIIDTHLHLVDMGRLSYPWLESFEPLRRDHSYETYADEARRHGITDVLHMEVDVAETDIEAETAMVQELARRPDSLIRAAVSACRPESPGFPAFLERQRANPFIRGFRRVLHVQPDELSETTLFRENVARLAGSGLSFDLCVLPHQLPKATALADAAPDVQLVLDHCGVPAVKDRALHPWSADIAELARRPNVAVKISGVVAYAGDKWTDDDLRPFVEHAIAAFGWDRVVWGSDWPVCTLTASLTRWVEATHRLLEGCSQEETSKLWAGNARRFYRLNL